MFEDIFDLVCHELMNGETICRIIFQKNAKNKSIYEKIKLIKKRYGNKKKTG